MKHVSDNSLFLFFSLFLIALPTLADNPIISNIVGQIEHGKPIQITGQFFGTKVPAAPRYWADFESGIDPSTLSISLNWTYESTIEHTNVNSRPRSVGSIRGDVATSGASKGPSVQGMNSERWYAFFKRYYDFDIVSDKGPSGFNLKVNRMWANTVGGQTNNIHIGWQGNEGLASGRAFNEHTSVTGTAQSFRIPPFESRQWITEEIIYATGDVGVQNGVFDYYRNGVPAWTGRTWRMRTQSLPEQYNIFFFDQVSNGTGPGPLWIYYDEIYMDDTWARVMACDTALWNNCKHKEVQIPISWNDGQIEFIANFGDFDIESHSIFLFVLTGEGLVNPVGELLYRCNGCPMPPAQLGAQ